MRKSESETAPQDSGENQEGYGILAVQKTSYFGDEWNEIGDGEDRSSGGAREHLHLVIFCLFEINKME